MRKLGLVICITLSSSAFADSLTISDAFKNGKVEGSIALYGQKVNYKNQNEDFRNSAYGNGHLGIAYTTDSFYGFSAKVEAKGNLKLGEQHKHDWKDVAPYENSALFTQAYLQYEMDGIVSIKAGRYEGEYEWLNDYHQGGVIEVLSIPDTVVALGYSNKKSESGIDLSEDFHKPELSEDGVYFLDIQNESFENVLINPYFYEMPDYGRFYGLKVSLDTDNFAFTAQYAKSDADSKVFKDENGDEFQFEDGYIAHIEGTLKIEDFEASLGYIKTDKDGGAVQIAAFGDTISLFEDGDYVYDPDARTVYLNLAYSIAGFDFGALYGITKHSRDDFKTKELNLSVGYEFTENLSTSLVWVNVNNKDFEDRDYNKYIASIEYKF